MDEGKLKQEVYIGKRIAEFLADEEIKKVFEHIEGAAVHEWRNGSDPHASTAWYRLKGLEAVRAELQSRVNTGNMAAKQMEKRHG